MEDYLKTIYHLREELLAYGEVPHGSKPDLSVPSRPATTAITTQAVAESLGVAPPSATAMIKKLAALDLVRHTPYHGVELTPSGEKVALEIIRHHRLSETFLAQIVGIDWDKAHQEADKWEHILSEEVEERMAALLGHPTHDPHGAPIPEMDGRIPRESLRPLSRIEAGKRVVVRRVSDENAELLRHLKAVGLVPGTPVEVLRANPTEGVLGLRVGDEALTLGLSPAAEILVEEIEDLPPTKEKT